MTNQPHTELAAQIRKELAFVNRTAFFESDQIIVTLLKQCVAALESPERVQQAEGGNPPEGGKYSLPPLPHAGFVYLPEKPTPKMLDALRTGSRKDWPSDELSRVRYAALIAAAPTAPAQDAQGDVQTLLKALRVAWTYAASPIEHCKESPSSSGWMVERASEDESLIREALSTYATARAAATPSPQASEGGADLVALADAFQRSADFLDFGKLTGSARTHPLVGTADYRAAAVALRELDALRASSPADHIVDANKLVLSCEWTEESPEEMPGTYRTACGELFAFTEGGLKENFAKFCQYCGGGIVTKESST